MNSETVVNNRIFFHKYRIDKLMSENEIQSFND